MFSWAYAQPSVTKEDQENDLQLSLHVHVRGYKMFYLHSVFLHWLHMIIPLNSNLNNSVYHLSSFCSCISFQLISLIVLLCNPFLKYSTNFFCIQSDDFSLWSPLRLSYPWNLFEVILTMYSWSPFKAKHAKKNHGR